MAKRTGFLSGRVESSESLEELPYRPILDWPTSIFIEDVLAHLKATAQPETCDLLFRNKISKNTKFRIVRRLELDRRKRPEGDLAPCPMCTANRFLSGALVFLPDLLCCAVIGHCCAGKEARDEAEREYRSRTRRDYEESLLLTTLPIVPKKGAVLAKLRPAAEEAKRLYRRLRRDVPSVHVHRRDLKARRGGHLNVTELIERRDGEDDVRAYGPMGLSRSGNERTKEIEFGAFVGQTAATKDYNPIKELDNVVRILNSLEVTLTETDALDFIVLMTEKQRRAAVAIIEAIDSSYGKFVAKLHDFGRFFTASNIELVNAYGEYLLNPFRISAKYETISGRPRVTIQHSAERCQLLIGPQLYDINFEWPTSGE